VAALAAWPRRLATTVPPFRRARVVIRVRAIRCRWVSALRTRESTTPRGEGATVHLSQEMSLNKPYRDTSAVGSANAATMRGQSP
jgi:hypothetical protein